MSNNTNPVNCRRCNKQVDAHHWKWEKDTRYKLGGKWRCKVRLSEHNKKYRGKVKADPIRNENRRKYERKYYSSHGEVTRFKSMKHFDKKRGFNTDINLDSYRKLILKPCYFCGKDNSGGLDRIDNARGHVLENVVPCCEKCNNILTDLPMKAKEKLKSGLHEIWKENLLKDWIIPTKRKMTRSQRTKR